MKVEREIRFRMKKPHTGGGSIAVVSADNATPGETEQAILRTINKHDKVIAVCVCVLHIKPFFYSSTSSTPSAVARGYVKSFPFVPSLRVQVFGSCSDYLILVLL